MLHVDDLKTLRDLLGGSAAEDPDLQLTYTLGATELLAIGEHYGTEFEPGGRECQLRRAHSIDGAPYLVHTNYELFLMLEGVKPFAMFAIDLPAEPVDHPFYALFEPHIRAGRIIKRVLADELFDTPIRGATGRVFTGLRRIFYTLPGGEWRVDAHGLLRAQLHRGLAWNDTLERLEGSLLGYTDAQNDWWIERRRLFCGPF